MAANAAGPWDNKLEKLIVWAAMVQTYIERTEARRIVGESLGACEAEERPFREPRAEEYAAMDAVAIAPYSLSPRTELIEFFKSYLGGGPGVNLLCEGMADALLGTGWRRS